MACEFLIADVSKENCKALNNLLADRGNCHLTFDGRDALKQIYRRSLLGLDRYNLLVIGPKFDPKATRELMDHLRWYEDLIRTQSKVPVLIIEKNQRDALLSDFNETEAELHISMPVNSERLRSALQRLKVPSKEREPSGSES